MFVDADRLRKNKFIKALFPLSHMTLHRLPCDWKNTYCAICKMRLSNLMPSAVVKSCILCVLTQLVPVGQQDRGAVEDMRQGCLDQFPAGDALDGL